MSKLARKPLIVPEGVTLSREDGFVSVQGKMGVLRVPLLKYIDLDLQEREAKLTTKENHVQARANWGTMASLLKSAMQGVHEGFEKRLEIEGIGFKASMDGKTLVLAVGFTHPVTFMPPETITIKTEKNVIVVSGADKALVGEIAARIRKVKKPEPYKGKGIHYVGEVIRRKAGKKVAGVGAEGKK